MSWPKLVCGLILFKVMYIGCVCLALTVSAHQQSGHTQGRDGLGVKNADASILARHFATWDAVHYLQLSDEGYERDSASSAFFPLFPLAIRWGAAISGSSHLLVGLALANVLSLLAWLMFFEMCCYRFGGRVAKLSLLLLLVYPGSLFFQFVYSESVFFVLVILLWSALERKRYAWACLAAFLLPLSRAVGLFCLLPVLWYAIKCGGIHLLRVFRGSWDHQTPARIATESGGVHGSSSLVCLVPFAFGAGVALYLGLMRGWTGNAYEGFLAQEHWGVHSIWNLVNIPKAIVALLSPTAWHAWQGSLLDRALFILVVYMLPVIWRRDRQLVLWTLVLGVLPGLSGSFTSFTRYSCCAFPVFVGLASVCLNRRSQALTWGLVALFAVLHIVLLWRFVNFRWAG